MAVRRARPVDSAKFCAPTIATQTSSNSEFAENLVVESRFASLKVSSGVRDRFRVPCSDRFVVVWSGHSRPESGVPPKTFQHTLRRNNFVIRHAVDQFV